MKNNHVGQESAGAISLSSRIGGTILVLATLYVCYFGHLGASGFVGNEANYASVARTMADTGDWVTPYLFGKPWFEKPPLYYWSAALSFKLFGMSTFTARFPCALYALLATLAMAWLALRLYGAGTVRWLFLFFPVSVGMIAFSHDAVMDMPFSAMIALAMVGAADLLHLAPPDNFAGALSSKLHSRGPTSTLFSAILFGCFLGLAVLAKGPAALIVCGSTTFFWALITTRWRDAFRLLHPAAIAAFCVTALPWYFLCARRNPDFFQVFIIDHNFKRYLTPQFGHIEPAWFYIPILLLACLPWAPAAIWAAVQGGLQLRKSKTLPAGTLFLVVWPLFTVCFFSLSRTKMPGYVLPAVPPLLLLLARICERLAFERRKSFAATLAIATAAGFAATHWMGHIHLKFGGRPVPPIVLTVMLLAMGSSNAILAAGVFWASKQRVRDLVIPLSALPMLLLLIFGTAVAPGPKTPQPSAKNPASRLSHLASGNSA